MQITATLSAWMNLEYNDVSDLHQRAKEGKNTSAVNQPIYSSTPLTGYTEVGTAEITLTLFPENELHGKQLDALKEQLQEVRAENQRRENFLLDKIGKLQAIGYEVEA